jgi:hypothetical protein
LFAVPKLEKRFGRQRRFAESGLAYFVRIVISELESLSSTNILSQSDVHDGKMAARFSVARAARQLTSGAARKPSAFVCQRWQRPAVVERRLFSVSAAGTD